MRACPVVTRFADLRRYRSALAIRPYRRLWSAAVVSRAGDVINFVALPLFVYAASRGSATAVAALVVAEGLGLVLGGILAQFLVDRIAPRRLLVLLDVGRTVLALILAVAPSPAMALAVAFGLALGTATFSPLTQALIPRLVEDHALAAANALQWWAGVVLQLAAAPLGGLLVAVASARAAFALDAASFAISAIILAGLPALSGVSTGVSTWRQLPETVVAIRGLSVVAPLAATQMLAALAVGATSALLVVLAQGAYGMSATGYGLWMMAIGAGALLGPILATDLGGLTPGRAVTAGYIVRGAGDILLGLASAPLFGGFLLVVYGINTSSGMVAYQTLLQRAVPGPFRGRVFALLDVIWQASRLLSVAGGAALATAAGVRAVFVAGGILLVLAGAVGGLWLPRAIAAGGTSRTRH